jgi:lipopolysaccharide export system protein LptA
MQRLLTLKANITGATSVKTLWIELTIMTPKVLIFKPLYHSLALLCIWVISLMQSGTLTAQSSIAPVTTPQDSSKKLKIETAFQVEYFVRGDRTIQKLSGNVRMRQDDVLVFCDTAILDEFDARLKGNVVIQQHDTVKVFADSAHYRTDTKISELYKDVVLENGRQKLFTQRLRYDLGQKIATYHTGATMSNGKSQLVSKHGYYYVDDGDMYFKGNVVVTDPEFTMRSDTLAFNSKTQLVRFVAPTLISQPKGKIYTEGGFYDIENNFAEFDLNPQYDREGQIGTAKKMRYSGTSKEYVLEGDALIDDKPKGRKTRADVIRYNSDTEDTYLRGNADYQDSTRNIKGEEIRYNSRDKNYQIKGRGRVNDPPNIIEADSLSFNDQLGAGVALGSVDWRDTSVRT